MHRLVSVDLILWSVQKYSRILFGLGNDWEMTQFRERVYIIVTWQFGTTHYNPAASTSSDSFLVTCYTMKWISLDISITIDANVSKIL